MVRVSTFGPKSYWEENSLHKADEAIFNSGYCLTIHLFIKLKMNQYFSKYRNAWIDFATPPTPGQISEMKKHKYRLIIDGVKI